MKKLTEIVLLLAFASPAFAQHPEIVASVKAELQSKGVDLSGPCGAFSITKRVAWLLRGEGAGLLDKPSGNNCQGFAVDIIAYPGTHIFDTLIDAGGANGPAWQDGGLVEPERYRPAFNPGDTPVVVPPPVISTPPPPISTLPTDLSTILAELRAHEAADKAERDAAAIFREDVRKAWRDRLVWISKYVLPAIGAVLAGRASK